MDLASLVDKTRLANRDAGPQSDALIRALRAETPATIIALYDQAQQAASEL